MVVWLFIECWNFLVGLSICLIDYLEAMPSAAIAVQTVVSGSDESVRLDRFFVSLVKAYVQVVDFVNHSQAITRMASYKVVMGCFCAILFVYYANRIVVAYAPVLDYGAP